MKNWITSLCALLLLGLGVPAKADIAEYEYYSVLVSLVGCDTFPDSTFYILAVDYDLTEGHGEVGEPQRIYLCGMDAVSTGDARERSYIYADWKGRQYKSAFQVGGEVQSSYSEPSYFVDRYRILGFNPNGTLMVQEEDREWRDEEGEVLRTVKKGQVPGQNWVVMALPLVCALGLLLFFLLRRGVSKSARAS